MQVLLRTRPAAVRRVRFRRAPSFKPDLNGVTPRCGDPLEVSGSGASDCACSVRSGDPATSVPPPVSLTSGCPGIQTSRVCLLPALKVLRFASWIGRGATRARHAVEMNRLIRCPDQLDGAYHGGRDHDHPFGCFAEAGSAVASTLRMATSCNGGEQ
jgi:hypothetical protein